MVYTVKYFVLVKENHAAIFFCIESWSNYVYTTYQSINCAISFLICGVSPCEEIFIHQECIHFVKKQSQVPYQQVTIMILGCNSCLDGFPSYTQVKHWLASIYQGRYHFTVLCWTVRSVMEKCFLQLFSEFYLAFHPVPWIFPSLIYVVQSKFLLLSLQC